eukprot:460700-Alexandrium_andersonii.AAC.1
MHETAKEEGRGTQQAGPGARTTKQGKGGDKRTSRVTQAQTTQWKPSTCQHHIAAIAHSTRTYRHQGALTGTRTHHLRARGSLLYAKADVRGEAPCVARSRRPEDGS